MSESKPWYRNGQDHRSGQAMGFNDIRQRFGFRAIRIGRWVTRAEQDQAAIRFYDALCDLMDILQGPESLISLRGTLSLEYGTGGQPGVSAHYTPASRSFALAKNAGPGSIAHEWFHAFDHYIGQKAFIGAAPEVFGARAWLNEVERQVHPLNQALFGCYQAVLLSADGQGPSALFRQSAQMDRQYGRLYYSLPEELCARAFEAFVQDATIKNHFLVQGTKASDEARLGLFPKGEERERINAAFDGYFRNLGTALYREPPVT